MAATVYTPVVMGRDTPLNLTTALAGAVTPGGLTGDSFVNTGHELFYHINSDGANAKTVVFSAGQCSYGVEHDLTETTPASTTKEYGPFSVEEFGSSIPVTFSGTGGVTNVKVLIVQHPYV
jgi:hypothetical protein